MAVKGFVLAAGRGERMRPITDGTPKPLLPVGGVALIVYALALLKQHGICDIIINVHHLGEQIVDALGDGAALGVKLTYSKEEELLGTGGALKRMDHALDDTFVVVNADILIDVDLSRALKEHCRRQALATMVLRKRPASESFGLIDIDGEGRILGLVRPDEDPATHLDGTQIAARLMFCGVHIIEPRFLEYIPEGVPTCIVRYAYAKALSNHEALRAHVIDGTWLDAGTPARFLEANRLALTQQLALPHLNPLDAYAHKPARTVAEVARLGEHVDLGQGSRLAPPVAIGDRTRIGERAVLGPQVVVGRNAVIGREAQLKDVVVLDNAKVEPNAQLVSAVVGKKHILRAQLDQGRDDRPQRPSPEQAQQP